MSFRIIDWTRLSLVILLAVSIAILVACSPSAVKPTVVNGPSSASPVQPSATVPDNTGAGQPAPAPGTSNTIDVVVAGYITHGPLQPTVTAIKDVLSKYGDKVKVTWVDLNTQQGQDYFKAHGLSAHMNVIINGTSKYQVNGKTVEFLWFEGQQWTRKDLDTVLAGLVTK
jgi:hypothetical protein